MANLLRTKYYENLIEILSEKHDKTIRINNYLSQFNPSNVDDTNLQAYSQNLTKCKSK